MNNVLVLGYNSKWRYAKTTYKMILVAKYNYKRMTGQVSDKSYPEKFTRSLSLYWMYFTTFRVQAAKPTRLRFHLFACESKQIQSQILHISPIDIVRHASTQNQSNISFLNSMTICLCSALRKTYGRMIDRLIDFQQKEWHHFCTILKMAYARFASHSLVLSALTFLQLAMAWSPQLLDSNSKSQIQGR